MMLPRKMQNLLKPWMRQWETEKRQFWLHCSRSQRQQRYLLYCVLNQRLRCLYIGNLSVILPMTFEKLLDILVDAKINQMLKFLSHCLMSQSKLKYLLDCLFDKRIRYLYSCNLSAILSMTFKKALNPSERQQKSIFL